MTRGSSLVATWIFSRRSCDSRLVPCRKLQKDRRMSVCLLFSPVSTSLLLTSNLSSHPKTRGPCCKNCEFSPLCSNLPENYSRARRFPLYLFADFSISSSINDDVVVRLKWGQTEYKGRLISVDSYMNIQLSNTEEFIDMKSTGTLGQVLIR